MTQTTHWEEIEEQDRQDLIAWYNRREEDLDDDDYARLAELFGAGQFEAWDCPQCGERCYMGQPDDWGQFQGVLQNDYASYPGNDEKYQPDYIYRMCDDCRMAP